ncbi:uncharacterized protein LOC126274364 isoform X7 [Schistocerca gregaria]|uniref:uncharacterized protein LOC126274364 isoform X7 n=1 Tax=Schistocerca gregaria TaxID=7010 RepID=UPI00211EA361|nr:uncharacterized protein LOC126274364 isoform X7 [Schistocerca gregaria]
MAAPLSSSAAAAAAAAVAVATLLAALTGEVSAQRRGSRLASGAPSSSASNAAADFDCPEEFGYYPHPTDCTQYYVCVFGGALVESCTGGLMYSHELQTCDWPRNVGCGAGEGATVSTVRVTDPRTRQTTPSALPPSRAPVAISRGQQEQQRQQQEEIVKHQLYAEDVGPAEEVEIDRQQRVYRGQPSTLGQVQRDRDGLRHQPVNNVIPAPTGRASSGDKIAVISFGTQQQVQPAQYSSDLLTQDNYLTFETPQRRAKRQIHLRFPQQIAPQSQRLPFWSAPQPPPVGRLPPAQSFSSSPSESVSSSGFRPIPNPDVRNFQSLELRPPQESLQSTHNAKTFHPLSPHSLFTTPQTRVNVPSSNKAFQKGSSPVSTALTPSKYFVSFGNSSQATYAQNLPGIIYYTPLGDENYSFFNLGGSYFQSAPSASQQFNVQNQNHFPVNPPVHVNANSANRNGEQSNFKVLRPLTSMHELPYNENGKPLFRVADEPDTTRNADALTESSSKLSKMRQGASQIQISFPTASVQESIRHQAKVPATLEQHGITYYSEPSVTDGIRNYYEPNIYSHVPTKHHSPEERNTNGQIAQNHVRHKEIPSRVEYLQRKIPNTGSTLSAYDSHTEDSNAKLLRATATQQNKHHATQLSPEPRQRPNKSSGGNLYPDQNERDYDEDYVSEQDDENHFFQPPPDFFEDVNKFSHIENPFADINFDFDTYIEKLRGEVPNQKKLNETNTKNIKLNDSELENNGELETSEEGTAVEEEEVDITQKSTDSVSGNAEPSFNEETAKYSQPSVDKSKTETVPVATHKINRSRGRQRAYVQQDLHRKLPAVPLQQPAKQRGTVRNNHHVTQKTHVTEAPTSLRGKERHYKLAEEPTSPVYDKGKAVTAQQYNNYKGSQTYDHTTHKNIQRIPQTVKEHAQTSEDSFSTTSSRTHSASDKERPYTDYAAQEERYETTTAGYDNTYNHGSETTTIRTKSNKRKLPNRQNSDSLQGNYFQGGSHTSSEPTETEQKHHTTPDRKLLEQGQNFYTQNSEWQGVNEGKITAQHPVPIDTNAPGYINKEIPVKYVDTAALKVDFTESSDNDETIKATFKGNVVNYLPRNPNHTHISYTNISDIQENNKINVIGRQNRRHPVSLNLQSSSNRTSPTIYTDYPILTTDTTIPSAQLLQTTSKTHAVTRRPSANQLTRLRSRRPTSTSLPNDSLNNTDYSPTLPRPSLTVNPYSQRPSHKETAEQSRIIKRPKDSDSDIEETYNRPLPARSQLIKDEYGNENTIRVEPSNSYQPQPQSAVPTNPTIYNSSQQYDTAAQYDPYYNNYDEDVELYRDIDYGQYTGSQNNQQQPYRGNQNTYKTAPQPTAPQRTNSYVQPSYSSQDIYTQQQQPQQQQQQQQQQQDYSDSYNTQLSDEQYREPSRTPSSRVRPTTASPESQTTPTPSRTPTVNRNRGSSPYVSNSGTDTVNRGTPASVRTRPTLKPSTAFVSKAQEFVDIYKYPPSRPAPVYPQPQVDKTAAKCRKDVCLLPDCFCGGKDIPGDLPVEQVPQIVLLTFDDSANDLNKGLYSDLFEKGRKNPNGCPIAATFYVSHEWTDYSHVQNLYASGHEIASHSISHSFGEQFSQKKWSKEIGGQREILAQYGGVRLEDVRGMRAPFLAIGGNKMFKMLYDLNFTYDSSMPVYENRPPSWPYTLDYKIFHDCMIPPCPTRSYPGVWEVPMVMWQDLNGGRCSMGDACSNPPTADGVYKMLIKNFERHYTTNRAPFGLFYHAAWFTQPHHKEGFEAFLDTIVAMDDVWLVTNWQAIQWVRQPTPLSEIKNFPPFQCNYADRPKKCNNPKVCNLWHKSGVRYMRTCQACPEVYPWTGKTGVKNSRIDNEIYEET